MTDEKPDDLILCGGGVIGLAIALKAARRGWNVRIFDQRGIGSGSSWAGAGILPPGAIFHIDDPLEKLRSASHSMFSDWCLSLEEETQINVGFRRCGGVYLARTYGELATLAANQTWWEEHGITCERWTAQKTGKQIPALLPASQSGELKAAWFLPDECQIRNPRYLKALESACRKRGVLIHPEEPILEIDDQNDLSKIRTSHKSYSTKRVCICAGAWTQRLLPDAEWQTGILPVRGQIVLFHTEQPLFRSVINEGHRYLVPRDDGYLLAGSCEEVGFDENTTPAMIEQLARWARHLVPSLKSIPIERSWAGLRPGSFDGLPYMGKLPASENIFIAAGHYRHGIHLSPITAELMVSLMAGETTRIDLSPFRVIRGKTYS